MPFISQPVPAGYPHRGVAPSPKSHRPTNTRNQHILTEGARNSKETNARIDRAASEERTRVRRVLVEDRNWKPLTLLFSRVHTDGRLQAAASRSGLLYPPLRQTWEGVNAARSRFFVCCLFAPWPLSRWTSFSGIGMPPLLSAVHTIRTYARRDCVSHAWRRRHVGQYPPRRARQPGVGQYTDPPVRRVSARVAPRFAYGAWSS